MSHIYTITAISENGEENRCFGFYFTRPEAERAILRNSGDMEECLYRYIILEKQGPGIHSLSEQVKWFRWNPYLNGSWVECERPLEERFMGITNWAGIG